MSDRPDWLPPLVLLQDYNGNWQRYLDALYLFFHQDFVASRPTFRGQKLGLKKHPEQEGKEATFWHFITSGQSEENRLPELRRCERIRWPRPIIEAVDSGKIKYWMNVRKNGKAHVLALNDFSYKVVLLIRNNYLIPWTAFYIETKHERKKLEREYHEFCRLSNS